MTRNEFFRKNLESRTDFFSESDGWFFQNLHTIPSEARFNLFVACIKFLISEFCQNWKLKLVTAIFVRVFGRVRAEYLRKGRNKYFSNCWIISVGTNFGPVLKTNFLTVDKGQTVWILSTFSAIRLVFPKPSVWFRQFGFQMESVLFKTTFCEEKTCFLFLRQVFLMSQALKSSLGFDFLSTFQFFIRQNSGRDFYFI